MSAPRPIRRRRPEAPEPPTAGEILHGVSAGAWTILAVLIALFVWSYWPTLVSIVGVWDREPDYSHGYLVVPIVLYFLWRNRDRAPLEAPQLAWGGLGLLALSVLMRFVGARLFIDSVDGWSIPIWIAGMVWMFAGRRWCMWAFPAIAFLWFAVPMPWRFERLLSYPLQKVATVGGTYLLQCLGQPAIASGNTIMLGEQQLEVAQACIGMRMLMGITAVAVAFIILVRKPWWEKLMLLAAVIPVAISANLIRITATGLLYQYVSTEAGKKFTHDVAGWVMIPLAASMFALVLWWLNHLFLEVESADSGDIIRNRRTWPRRSAT